MSTIFLRNTTEAPSAIKWLLGKLLPLSMKRHLLYLKHYRRIGNFRTPRLLSEKMQWRIINDRREILRYTCDKRATKRQVAELAENSGLEIRVPRQIAWAASADDLLQQLRLELEAGRLPLKWVMKPNHSSGRALAVDGEPDWEMVEQAARAWLAPSRFNGLHWIWPYTTAEIGLLAEEFVPAENSPVEWQLWVVNGAVMYTVAQQRIGASLHRSTFDSRWNLVVPWYNRDATTLKIKVPPVHWESVERAALSLSFGWELIRVDLFQDEAGGVWFGELTPYPSEGLFSTRAGTRHFDESAGAAWILPHLQENERG